MENEKSFIKSLNPDLESIILNSKYQILVFQGRSDGANLQPNFNINIIRGMRVLIKSIRLIPYAFSESDVFFDNTNTVHFTVPAGGRLINVVDEFSTTARIDLFVNGGLLPIFPTYIGNIGYPLDLYVDNIYFYYKAKVETINMSVTGNVMIDLNTGAVEAPNLKVLIECYIF